MTRRDAIATIVVIALLRTSGALAQGNSVDADLAELAKMVKERQQAVEEVRGVLKSLQSRGAEQPMVGMAYTLLGTALVDLCFVNSVGNREAERAEAASEAQRAYSQAVTLGADPAAAFLGSGRAAACHEEFEAAAEYYKTALRADPTVPEANRYLGIAYVELGRFQNAREVLEVAVQQDRDDEVARFHLASVYFELGLPELARRQCEALGELGYGSLCGLLKAPE